jgi:hypothetical protein
MTGTDERRIIRAATAAAATALFIGIGMTVVLGWAIVRIVLRFT